MCCSTTLVVSVWHADGASTLSLCYSDFTKGVRRSCKSGSHFACPCCCFGEHCVSCKDRCACTLPAVMSVPPRIPALAQHPPIPSSPQALFSPHRLPLQPLMSRLMPRTPAPPRSPTWPPASTSPQSSPCPPPSSSARPWQWLQACLQPRRMTWSLMQRWLSRAC